MYVSVHYRMLLMYWGVLLTERDHAEDLSVNGRIILKWFLKKWDGGGTNCIDLTQDRDRLL